MVVTPKANDLTGRKDSRGYIMGTLIGQGLVPSLRLGSCS